MLSHNSKDNITARIESTIEEQKTSYDKILKGKPLDAEDDILRRIAFQNRRSTDINKFFDQVDSPIITGKKLVGSEKIQGDSIDFVGVHFLDLGKAAASTVARVILRDEKPQGSGFLISPSLFLTNNHVLSSVEECKKHLIEFNYQQDYRKKYLTTSIFELDPDSFFHTSFSDDLDFTVVAVGRKISGSLELSDIGFLPIFDFEDKHAKGMFVNVIQHPNGMPKQLVVRENRLLARTDNTLIYSSDTEEGSSGSPVFNDDFEVLALHHWSGPYKAVRDIEGTDHKLPKYGNEGIRLSSIVKNLNANLDTFNSIGSKLINEALSFPFRSPSRIIQLESLLHTSNHDNGSEKIVNLEKSSLSNLNKNSNSMSHITQNEIEVTIPITITVRIGENGSSIDASTAKGTPAQISEGPEKLKPDFNYTSRKGYNSKFLGIEVPLPKLSKMQKKKASINLDDMESNEFKYQHFSVVMNKVRKLAYFTAVNIDGGSVVKINRTTGEVTRGPEGREKWYSDNRINPQEVCTDDLYLEPEMKIFQRGHLVKRTDPSWGTEAKSIKGQADTFHFTNCAPQHALFNPNTNKWAGIENWITNISDNEDIRVSVFSGPIFETDDPEVSGLLIPKAFWKIVYWVEDGVLKAVGLLADQSDLLIKSGVGPESIKKREALGEFPYKLKEFKCSIAHLEKITGFEFGNLTESDIYEDGAEGIGKEKVEINSFEEIFRKVKPSEVKDIIENLENN